MAKISHGLIRGERIALFLYEFGNGKKTKMRYEDIVVGLFKKYPKDFHLKGYEEYPDSGDSIHKPLYDFKKKGYVDGVNKIFSLTDSGIEYAKKLIGRNDDTPSGSRLSRKCSVEVIRVKSLEGLGLFLQSAPDRISENDFYVYLGVTVRTPRNVFIGRMETMNAVIAELRTHQHDLLYRGICCYNDFLLERYSAVIAFFTK